MKNLKIVWALSAFLLSVNMESFEETNTVKFQQLSVNPVLKKFESHQEEENIGDDEDEFDKEKKDNDKKGKFHTVKASHNRNFSELAKECYCDTCLDNVVQVFEFFTSMVQNKKIQKDKKRKYTESKIPKKTLLEFRSFVSCNIGKGVFEKKDQDIQEEFKGKSVLILKDVRPEEDREKNLKEVCIPVLNKEPDHQLKEICPTAVRRESFSNKEVNFIEGK